MRIVTAADNPYKIAGDILLASSEVKADFRSVDLYGTSVRRKKKIRYVQDFILRMKVVQEIS